MLGAIETGVSRKLAVSMPRIMMYQFTIAFWESTFQDNPQTWENRNGNGTRWGPPVGLSYPINFGYMVVSIVMGVPP